VRRQPFLLILDNFEQLAEEGASLSGACSNARRSLPVWSRPGTSSTRRGARISTLRPLPVPSMQERRNAWRSTPAFACSPTSAAARPDFQITRDNAATISALCERLEGIPSPRTGRAWVGTLTVPQILARLEHRFDLLTAAAKTFLRHRTLARHRVSFACFPPN